MQCRKAPGRRRTGGITESVGNSGGSDGRDGSACAGATAVSTPPSIGCKLVGKLLRLGEIQSPFVDRPSGDRRLDSLVGDRAECAYVVQNPGCLPTR